MKVYPMVLLTTLLVAILAVAPPPQSPQTIHRTEESIVKTMWLDDNKDGMICTGFSVGIMWVITAKHCLPPNGVDITVNGDPARVVKSNDAFALLEVQAGKYPILQLRKDQPKVGEAVTSFGFPYGFPLMSFQRHIAAYCECDYAKGDHLIMDGRIGSGMSGGPVIDETGKVVGLNQAGVETITIACTAEEISKFINGK